MNAAKKSEQSILQRSVTHIRSHGIGSFIRAAVRYLSNRLAGSKAPEHLSRPLPSLGSPDSYPVGSESWLISTESHFGGIQRNVKRRTVSEFDPRAQEELNRGGMVGGDRMFHHGYGAHYAKHLERFVLGREKSITVVEAGILRGTGLALWSKLFPRARLIGLDIDLSHFRENEAFLRSRGAFVECHLETHAFDQFVENSALMARILGGGKIDVVVDDGFHSNETILNTIKSMKPFLADRFVYFIEDNDEVFESLHSEFPGCRLFSYHSLSVIER